MSWNRKPPLRTVTVALLATQVLSFAQEQERDEEPELDLSIWDYSVNLRGGLGYKDNVLLSNIDQQGSAFWQSALDAMLFRVDLENGGNLTLFLSAEDRRYFSDIEVEKEQLVLAQGKYERPFAEEWFWSATAQYLYVDQVFDASATEQLLVTLPVKSHNYQLAPAIGRNLHWNDRLELKLVAERQHFNQPLDDYWEFGPQLIYSRSYGHKSEVTASYTFDQRNYDTREQLDLDFASIPDTSLRYQQHEFELGLNHSWDTDRRWRSRAKFLFEINSDNGVGFYDYKRYRFSKRIGYYGDDWLATLEARVLHYDYDVQPVEETGEIRSNWEYVIAARAEKKSGRSFPSSVMLNTNSLNRTILWKNTLLQPSWAELTGSFDHVEG